MYSKLRCFAEYIDKTKQLDYDVFDTDNNTKKGLAPLVYWGGPGERKTDKINLVICVQEKKTKETEKTNYVQN